jgi:hypothetical protein
MRKVGCLLVVILTSLGDEAGAQQRSWEKIAASQGELVFNLAEFAGQSPVLGERSIVQNVRGADTVISNVERFQYLHNDFLAWFFRNYYEEGSITFRNFALSDTLNTFPEFRGKNVAIISETTYARGGAFGRIFQFTYKPGTIERHCVYFHLDRNGTLAERVSGVVCIPENRTLNAASAKRFADSMGSKRIPPTVSAVLAPTMTPQPSTTGSSPVSPTSLTAAERLRALRDLLDQKLISQEEHDRRRKAILDSM